MEDAFAAEENGSFTAREGGVLRDTLNLGGNGFDKNKGEEEGENTGDKGSGTFVSPEMSRTPKDSLLVVPRPLNRRIDFFPLRLLLRLRFPDPPATAISV